MTKLGRVLALTATLLLIGVALLTSRFLIRALPGRYAYYLPKPLQALRHNPHPETLPTPVLLPTRLPPTQTPSPTWTPTSSPTASPSPSPSPPATPLPTETPVPTPPPNPTLPAVFVLDELRLERQGWNNCGPATLAMSLSFWGRAETQNDIAPILKPDPEDKNVSLWEMEQYVRELGLGAIVRVGGSLNLLKELLHAGFPVIAETWYVRDAHDQLGHYRLLVGFDSDARQFITYDSLHGPDILVGFQELDELWRVFNRIYLVIYDPATWETLSAIIGPELDDVTMYGRALETARFEAANPPATCVAYAYCSDWVKFSLFNVGSSLTSLGRHSEAVSAYDQARQLGLHFRVLWYQFGPYESYYAAGRQDDVIALANATLATTANLEESYYWRGMARLEKGDTAGARADFKSALHYHAAWSPAASALEELEGH